MSIDFHGRPAIVLRHRMVGRNGIESQVSQEIVINLISIRAFAAQMLRENLRIGPHPKKVLARHFVPGFGDSCQDEDGDVLGRNDLLASTLGNPFAIGSHLRVLRSERTAEGRNGEGDACCSESDA